MAPSRAFPSALNAVKLEWRRRLCGIPSTNSNSPTSTGGHHYYHMPLGSRSVCTLAKGERWPPLRMPTTLPLGDPPSMHT